mmetsp:Transcript_17191/g.49051  ORF Transcript_17191/g.49051 Transcript_17191/m.49051 type:complete len:202 (+) Transcript_17191:278-883(+)
MTTVASLAIDLTSGSARQIFLTRATGMIVSWGSASFFAGLGTSPPRSFFSASYLLLSAAAISLYLALASPSNAFHRCPKILVISPALPVISGFSAFTASRCSAQKWRNALTFFLMGLGYCFGASSPGAARLTPSSLISGGGGGASAGVSAMVAAMRAKLSGGSAFSCAAARRLSQARPQNWPRFLPRSCWRSSHAVNLDTK